MIITCEKCSTRFNLDDSLLQKDGSKVRCSVCKNIFMAYSEPGEDDAALIAPSGLSLETEPDEISVSEADLDDEFSPGQVDEDGDDFSLESDDFSLEDDGLTLEDDSLAMEEEVFSIDDDQPLAEETDLQAPGEDSSFSLEDDSLEIEDNDLTLEDDGLTLEAEEFEIDVVEDGEVSFDEPEESPALEMEHPGLPGLESGDEEGDDDAFDGIEFEPLEDDLSGTEPESLEIETPDILETESSGDDEDAFELELELESGEDDGDALPEGDALTGAEDEEFELEFDIEEEADETPALEFDAKAESPDEPELPAQETPEEDFSSYDTVLEQDAEPGTDREEDAGESSIMPPPLPPQDEPPEEAPEDDETLLTPPPARRRRRKKKSSVSAPVMILMLLFLLIAGAYVASLMTGYQIPYLSDIGFASRSERFCDRARLAKRGQECFFAAVRSGTLDYHQNRYTANEADT